MEQIAQFASMFTFVLLLFTIILEYVLDLTLIVAALLSVSILSLGLLVGIGLESVIGLTIQQIVLSMGAFILVTAVTYEMVSS